MKSFPLDAYAVMDLQPGVPESDIKKRYRERSLFIHPDKCQHPQAPDAFDRLKKAQTELMDEKARTRLDEAIADARMLLIRERKWTVDNEELGTEEFRRDLREKTREVLVDNELRRRRQVKAQMREEGRQQMKEEEEAQERKRKREYEQQWEQTREQRIGSWRDFQAKRVAASDAKAEGKTSSAAVNGVDAVEKPKKKKKMKVLG
jgi:DnaJ family protein C protein 8